MKKAIEMVLREFRKESVALEFLVEAGTLERCQIHEDYTWDLGSIEDAISYAQFKERKGEFPKGLSSNEEFVRILERTYMNNAGFECALCGKYCVSD